MTDKHAQEGSKSEVVMQKSQSHGQNSVVKEYPRLPCRGCLPSCKNYSLCDGKLWRMAQ